MIGENFWNGLAIVAKARGVQKEGLRRPRVDVKNSTRNDLGPKIPPEKVDVVTIKIYFQSKILEKACVETGALVESKIM